MARSRIRVCAGRQRLAIDNQRFIGNVGWRQNEQTFDALFTEWTPRAGTRLQVHWLDRVHRVAGDEAIDALARERSLDGRLLHLQHAMPVGVLTAYGYWIEDRDVAAASGRTVGLRWSGQGPEAAVRWGLALEAAQQARTPTICSLSRGSNMRAAATPSVGSELVLAMGVCSRPRSRRFMHSTAGRTCS